MEARAASTTNDDGLYVDPEVLLIDLFESNSGWVPPTPRSESMMEQRERHDRHKTRKARKSYMCCVCAKSVPTINDLDRHQKTVHGMLRPGDKIWLCKVRGCAVPSKVWVRVDNFKQHIYRMHGEDFVGKAEEMSDLYHADIHGPVPLGGPRGQTKTSTTDTVMVVTSRQQSVQHESTTGTQYTGSQFDEDGIAGTDRKNKPTDGALPDPVARIPDQTPSGLQAILASLQEQIGRTYGNVNMSDGSLVQGNIYINFTTNQYFANDGNSERGESAKVPHEVNGQDRTQV